MKTVNVAIVQASSRSWSGGPDVCMNLMGDDPIIISTIKKLIPYCKCIVVVAPEFDRGGLDFLRDVDESLTIYYGQDESPLLRMVNATSGLRDEEYVLRLNALNFCVDMESALEMLSIASFQGFDVIRFPENFPPLFVSDIYRISALRRLADMDMEAMFHIHPKYAMTTANGFHAMIFQPSLDRYPDSLLYSVRAACASSIYVPRTTVDRHKAIKAGDSLGHHYEMALSYLRPDFLVLDMACGNGFGAAIMSERVANVTGIDIDESQLGCAGSEAHQENVDLVVADCLNTGLDCKSYDCITAFEIIEHVDPYALLVEISRLLKPQGLCFISTPQNVLGHIPTTPYHTVEYSLSGLLEIVSRYLDVEQVIGIKQGTIIMKSDPIGSNTFLVCRKREEG